MADDIDIEEHDVLDNPRIKQILPTLDISHIKTEAPDHGDYIMEETSNFKLTFEDEEESQETMDYEDEEDQRPEQPRNAKTGHRDSEEYVVRNNRIIIGNKPSTSRTGNTNQSLIFGFNQQTNVKTEPVDYYEENEENSEGFEDNRVMMHTPVLILGSKPSRDVQDISPNSHNRSVLLQNRRYDCEDVREAERAASNINSNRPTYLTVYVEDWGPKLDRSPRYCKDCQTLFPTRNCLDAHKMSAHSFLVALGTNVAVKSTSKGHEFKTKSTARKSTQHEPIASKGQLCHHCNKVFVDETALVKHLYENIDLSNKKIKCDVCNEVFPNKSELQAHMKSHETPEVGSEASDIEYYRCHICGFYSKLIVHFLRHMSDNHNVNVDVSELKKVPFDPTCIVCKKNATHHNNHIKNCHDVYYLDANKIQKPQTQKVAVSNETFKCNKCKNIFPTLPGLKRHIRVYHADTSNRVFFSKIAKSKAKFTQKVPSTKTLVRHPVDIDHKKVSDDNTGHFNLPIPKDVLFKCHCLLHFTNYSAACVHAYKCKKIDQNNVKHSKCQICKRAITMEDENIHQMQHKLTEKFRVYHVSERVYSTIMCKCTDCSLYFNEQDLWEHFNGVCGKIKSFQCDYCDLNIGETSKEVHSKMHKTLNASVNNLILIDFVSRAAITNRKRTYSEAGLQKPVMRKRHRALKVYFCKKCRGCFFKVLASHDERCMGSKRPVNICKQCGLDFPKKHYKFHRAVPNIKIQNLRFYDYKTLNPLHSPPIPRNPCCVKCNVHFASDLAKLKHECNDHFKTCRYCNKKFSDLALRLHVPLHTYRFEALEKAKTLASVSQPDTEVAKDMPELLKKYEQLTDIWNLLFKCKECSVVCDSYDKIVEHSQDHLCKPNAGFGNVKECKKCALQFEATSFSNHVNLHSVNSNLGNAAFKIITYDHSKLLTEEWFNMFEMLPKTHVDRIVSKSIYQPTRGIRMTVLKNLNTDHVLYKCARCLNYLFPGTMIMHHKMSSCSKGKISCTLCKIKFSTRDGKLAHWKDHMKLRIRDKMEATVVLVHKEEDDEYNKILHAMDTSVTGLTVTYKEKSSQEYVSFSKNFICRYYMCLKCKMCTTFKPFSGRRSHKCKDGKFKICSTCKLKFKPRGFDRHRAMHGKYPRLTKANFCITLVDPDTGLIKKSVMLERGTPMPTLPLSRLITGPIASNTSIASSNSKTGMQADREKIAPIYKCKCGLHFTSESLLKDHSNVCGPESKNLSENCSKCGLLFPTDLLLSHMFRHHRESDTETRVKTDSVQLSKCIKCDLCFLTSRTLLWHVHSKHAHVADLVTKCDECGLRFTRSSLRRHLEDHKVKNIKKIEVIEFMGRRPVSENVILMPGNVETKGKKVKQVLNKCTRCGVHMLSTLPYHEHRKLRCHEVKVHKLPYKKCPVCNWLFLKTELNEHVSLHHNEMNLKLHDFNIIARDFLTKNAFSKYEFTSKRFKAVLWQRQYDKILYKCTKCGLNFLKSDTFWKHKCTHQKRNCELCGYMFGVKSLSIHKLIHHEKMNLKRDDFRIIRRAPKSGITENTKRFDCDDELDTAEFESADKSNAEADDTNPGSSLESVDNDKPPEREGTIFSKYVLSDESKKSLDITKYSKKLYNCPKCDLSFVTYRSVERHYNAGCTVINKQRCDQCNRLFSLHSLNRHKEIHHVRMNLKREDLRIIIYSPEVTSYMSKRNEEIVNADKLNDLDETDGDLKSDISMYGSNNSKPVPREIVCSKNELENVNVESDSENCRTRTDFELSDESIKNLDITKYGKQLYNCPYCDLCFILKKSVDSHISRRCNVTDKFQCDQCNYMFTKTTLAKHKEIHHNRMNLKREDIVVLNGTEKTRAITINLDMAKYTNELYNCSKCDLCFIVKGSARAHNSLGCNEAQKFQCDQCNYMFTVNVLPKHKEIHHVRMNLKREDIVVINIAGRTSAVSTRNEELDKTTTESDGRRIHTKCELSVETKKNLDITKYGNELYKCPKCDLCFIVKGSAKAHNSSGCNEVQKFQCDQCNYMFTVNVLARHKEIHHVRMNLKREDIVVLSSTEFKKKEYELSAESKNSLDITRYGKELYNCPNCDLSFITYRSAERHHAEGCTVLDKYRCDQCNCIFSKISIGKHKEIHHVRMNLKREDLRIIIYNDALKRPNRRKRNEESVNLDESDDGSVDCGFNSTPTNKGPDKTDERAQYTESDMKRGSFEKFLMNVSTLYKCNKCSTYFVDRDSCVAHVNIGLCSETTTEECSDCGYDFGDGLRKHRRIHHVENKLNVEDFQIVQLRFIDSKLVTNCLFKCGRCFKNFLSETDALGHSCEFKINLKNRCKVCDLTFISDDLSHHSKLHHEVMKLERDFQIILCVPDEQSDESDDDLDNCENYYWDTVDWSQYSNNVWICNKCEIHFMSEDKLKIHITRCTGESNKIRCTHCDLHFSQNGVALHEHVHHKKMNLERDEIKVIESNESSTGNDTLGKNAMDKFKELSTADSVDDISNNAASSTPVPKRPRKFTSRKHVLSPSVKAVLDRKLYTNEVYKCKNCPLHYLDEVSARKHEHQCDKTVRAVPCEVCGIEFSYINIERHKYVHHEKMKLKKGKVLEAHRSPTNPKVKIFKCGACSFHFIEECALDEHIANKNHKLLGHKCQFCNLEFPDQIINTHINVHHDKEQTLNDFEIIIKSASIEDKISSVAGPSVKELKSNKIINDSKVQKLFMCAECGVYFNTQISFNKHTSPHKKLDTKEYIDCKLCGLPFKIASLINHVQTHHVDGFDFENLLIEEFLPKTDDGLVKLNTYFVKDKIQSRLVSTTTDVSSSSKLVCVTADVSSSEVKIVNKVIVKSDEIDCFQNDCDVDKVNKRVDQANVEYFNTIKTEEPIDVDSSGNESVNIDSSQIDSHVTPMKTDDVDQTHDDSEIDYVEILDDVDEDINTNDDNHHDDADKNVDCSEVIDCIDLT